jgi:hypothetical protein
VVPLITPLSKPNKNPPKVAIMLIMTMDVIFLSSGAVEMFTSEADDGECMVIPVVYIMGFIEIMLMLQS